MCDRITTATDWMIDQSGGAYRYDGEGALVIKPLPSKGGMVRKILRALFNNPSAIFTKDHGQFKKLMRKSKKDLVRDYILAEKIIEKHINNQLEQKRNG